MTSITAIAISVVSAFLGAIGQIFFKLGSKNLSFDIRKMMRNYSLIAGLSAYGVSALLFVYALRDGELSVLYPIIATSYIWVNFLAARFLNEGMNAYKWGATLLILAGVFLIGIA